MENEQFKLIDLIEETCAEKGICPEPMRIARDIMNNRLETLTLDHTVRDCLKLMESSRIRHIPIVDLPYEGEQKPCFIGVVSQRDVLRISIPNSPRSNKQQIDQRALEQSLVNIVARNPKSVSPQTPIYEVITILINNHIDMVPVLDGPDLSGIITTSDLMKLFSGICKTINKLCPKPKTDGSVTHTEFKDSAKSDILLSWVSRTIQEIMKEPVICLSPHNKLSKAIEVLQSKVIRHIVITGEQGEFLGLVSDRDILRNLPYAGRRPASPQKKFREYLFASDSWSKNLLIPLEDIMVRKAVHVSPNHNICDTADILYQKNISCLPIIDEQQKLRGIVTVIDMMQALLTVYEPAGQESFTPSESSIC